MIAFPKPPYGREENYADIASLMFNFAVLFKISVITINCSAKDFCNVNYLRIIRPFLSCYTQIK